MFLSGRSSPSGSLPTGSSPARLEAWLNWVNHPDIWPVKSGLKHGDLHPGHVLVNDRHEVTGLIDWTEAAVGDVSEDFLSIYLLFGEAGLDGVMAAYQRAEGLTWSGMKAHILALHHTSGITVAEYAEVSGLDEMKTMAEEILKAPPDSA